MNLPYTDLLKSVQLHQLINLILLISLAYSSDTLQIPLYQVFILAIFAISTELLINYYSNRELYFPASAVITAFGIILMIGWTQWYIPYILILLSIAQKRFLQIDKRHIFNPSNFAIIMALLIFYPKALPIAGQLEDRWYILGVIIFIGITILIRVKRLLLSITFIVFYLLFEYLVMTFTDPSFNMSNFVTHSLSASFIVYIFFMLTDPVTTPKSSYLQILFSFFVATLIVVLDYFIGEHSRNIFISLFITSIAFIPFYRRIESKIFYLVIFILAILSIFYILSQKPIYYYNLLFYNFLV
jgi:hypothetical protein